MYGPAFPFPFGLATFGIFTRSVNLLSVAPELEYTVIIPVYNKRDSIEGVLRAIRTDLETCRNNSG